MQRQYSRIGFLHPTVPGDYEISGHFLSTGRNRVDSARALGF